jgi:predicted Fe-Mo cluster-binding NifX family protein
MSLRIERGTREMRVSNQMMEKDENATDGQLVIASEGGSGETRSSVMRDHTMIRLAVPSEDESGLSARRSGHFGKCACFTVVEIDHGKLTNVYSLANFAHAGSCQGPVELLASNGVSTVVVGAIGSRPLGALMAAGIDVLYDADSASVGEAVEAVRLGLTPIMESQSVCESSRHSSHCGSEVREPS